MPGRRQSAVCIEHLRQWCNDRDGGHDGLRLARLKVTTTNRMLDGNHREVDKKWTSSFASLGGVPPPGNVCANSASISPHVTVVCSGFWIGVRPEYHICRTRSARAGFRLSQAGV